MRVRVDLTELLFGGTIWMRPKIRPNPIPRGSKKPFFDKYFEPGRRHRGGVGTFIHAFHQGSPIIV